MLFKNWSHALVSRAHRQWNKDRKETKQV
jgi:hypothetical protein